MKKGELEEAIKRFEKKGFRVDYSEERDGDFAVITPSGRVYSRDNLFYGPCPMCNANPEYQNFEETLCDHDPKLYIESLHAVRLSKLLHKLEACLISEIYLKK